MPYPCWSDDEDGTVDDRTGDTAAQGPLPGPDRHGDHPAPPSPAISRAQGDTPTPEATWAPTDPATAVPGTYGPHRGTPVDPRAVAPAGPPPAGPPPAFPPPFHGAGATPAPGSGYPTGPYATYPHPHHAPAPWTGPPGGGPPPRAWYGLPAQRDQSGTILFLSCVAAVVAVVSLVAGVSIVVVAPRQPDTPNGVDVATVRNDDLRARPNRVDVDLVDHPLYGVAMPPPVDCALPPLDVDSDASWEAFASEAGTCLNELWIPVMDELRLFPDLPEITVTEEALDTDTEDAFTLAYYESDRGLITVVLPNVREVSEFVPEDEQEIVWLALMGHEYAHHVQHATGILNVSHELRRTAGSQADELETLRRTELQAECMAGVGLRGLTDPDGDALDVVNRHFNEGGDLDTHGSAANRDHWLRAGWEGTTVAGCNTYDAPVERVA